MAQTQPGCVGIQMALASYYAKMKDLSKAQENLSNALKLDPKNRDILWLQAKVKREMVLQQQTQRLKDMFKPVKQEKMKMKVHTKVERCHLSSLSPKQFLFQYAMTGTPVIVTGMVLTHNTWNIEFLRKVIGHKNIPTNSEQKQGKSTPTVGQLIDSIHGDQCCRSELSLTRIGSELTSDLLIPQYVASDFLQRIDTCYSDNWPYLVIEPVGFAQSIHIEPLGLNCWISIFEGRKRFTLIQREDVPCLYPYCDDNLNIAFNASISHPDLKDFPLLSTIAPLECILEPGEFLFIPAGTPYAFETLDNCLSISGKYVDLSNLNFMREELQAISISDPNIEHLHQQLSSDSLPTKMWSKQNDLLWEEYKQWPRDSYQEFDITRNDHP